MMSSTLPLAPPPPFSGDNSVSSELTAASSADSAPPTAQGIGPAPDPEGGAAPSTDGPAPSAPAAAVATGPCQWSSTDSELMLTVLEEAAMQKLQSGGGFKPEVWRKASDKLAATWVKGGTKGPEQVKTHFRGLKKMWAEVHELLNMSGFGWDEKQKRATALDSVWDDLLANKPKFKKWKNRTFEYYDRMTALCAKCTATGSYARDAGGKDSEESGEDKSEDGDSSDDDDRVLPTRKRKRPSAVSAMGQIAEALKAMAGPADDEDEVGVVMEELLELDGDNFDVDELATLGLALAEKPKLIVMYRALKERDAMRLAFVRKILAAN